MSTPAPDAVLDTFPDAHGRAITLSSRELVLEGGLLTGPTRVPFASIIGGVRSRDGKAVHVWALKEAASTVKDAHTHMIKMRLEVPITLRLADEDAATELLSEIRLLATRCPPEPDRSKRVLMILNPHGGRGKRAKQVAYSVMAPLLRAAGMHVDAIETRYAGHAVDVGRAYDPSIYEGLVPLGGDGTAYEVVSGLLSRPQWAELVRRVPICTVRLGTNNAVAYGVRTIEPVYAAFCAFRLRARWET